MSSFADDAQRVFLLFNYGVMSGTDVINRAEDHVANSDSPSDPLLELAWASPNDTAEIISRLIVLTRGADIYIAFKKVLGYLYDYVMLHPTTAERITSRLLGTLIEIRHDTRAREFYFLYRCSDDFESVHQGEYVTRPTVLKFLLTELQKFTKTMD
jgi:hypothetical protein